MSPYYYFLIIMTIAATFIFLVWGIPALKSRLEDRRGSKPLDR